MSGQSILSDPIAFDLRSQRANTMFLKPMFVSSNILTDGFFRLKRNVLQTATMQFMGELSGIVQPNNGCGWTPKGNAPITQRDLTVQRHKINTEFCTDEFFDNCFEWLTGQEIDIEKLDATELGRLIQEFMMTVITRGGINDIFRLAWYGDDQSTDQFLSQANGFFKDIEADVSNALTPSIATGSGAPLAAGASETILTAAMDAQLDVLEDMPDEMKKFVVSKSIWNNYRDFIKNNPTIEVDRVTYMDGMRELRFCGILVEKCPQWDAEDARLGAAPQPKHRLVLAANQTMCIGTDITGTDTQFQTWFDMQDELQKVKAKFRLGFRVAHPELVVYGI